LYAEERKECFDLADQPFAGRRRGKFGNRNRNPRAEDVLGCDGGCYCVDGSCSAGAVSEKPWCRLYRCVKVDQERQAGAGCAGG
jgi:hypothetical protein